MRISLHLKAIRKSFTKYNLKKNPILKKYEAKVSNVSIDIYVKYYSEFPLPLNEIEKTIQVAGYTIPKPEILLILKQQAEIARKHSVKGQKDRIDILAMLISNTINIENYLNLIEKYKLQTYLNRLKEIISKSTDEYHHLGITNPRKIKKIKNKLLTALSNPVTKTINLAGSGSKHATPTEMKEMLDKLRNEDI